VAEQTPFRFGVQSFAASSAREWAERARSVEDLGYSVLSLADHYIGPGPAQEATSHPPQELAAVPAMAAAASATRSLRIACRVFCADYHHPIVLAKEAATLDLLSEGRLEIGLGAGWLEGEYDAIGIPFERPGLRIAKLAEAVTILKQHMSDQPIEFDGKHFRVHGFDGRPKPVQKPHPPIMIGGGAPRILSLAGREADIVSFNFNNRSGVIGPDGVQTSTAELTLEKVGWVKKAAGERFGELELEIGAYFTFVTDQSQAVSDGIGAAFGLTGEEMRAHPHALFGTVDTICDELVRRRELYGISYVTVNDIHMLDFAPVVAKLAGQ